MRFWRITSGLFLTASLLFAGMFLWKVYRLHWTSDERDFLYLSRILYENTHDIPSGEEQLERMTEWLHHHVEHVPYYPRDFDGSSLAGVVRSGAGNCGYQASNISAFAGMLGYEESRIYHFRPQPEDDLTHTFAEIKLKGNWCVFDPDLMFYQRDSLNRVLSFARLKARPDKIKNRNFAKVISRDIPGLYVISPPLYCAPTPFGLDGYRVFKTCGGARGFRFWVVWHRYGRVLLIYALGMTFVLFAIRYFLRHNWKRSAMEF